MVLAATPDRRRRPTPRRGCGAELAGADLIAAEDTRRLRRLLDRLGVSTGGPDRVLLRGQRGRPDRGTGARALAAAPGWCVVTDAGMPSVSDPGYRLVSPRRRAGHPGHRGARPVGGADRAGRVRVCRSTGSASRGSCRARPASGRRRLAELAAEPRTMVFFEAPHRTAETLAAMVEAFGPDRRAAVCRELTKTYEEIRRGRAGRAGGLGGRRGPRRGDPGGGRRRRRVPIDLAAAVGEVRALTAGGTAASRPCAQVAAAHGHAPRTRSTSRCSGSRSDE